MSKSDKAKAREQRLAAKLRENLKRRKGQAKARNESGSPVKRDGAETPPKGGKTG